MAEFAGKRIVITGGAGGIGVETARTMLAHGAHVVLVEQRPRAQSRPVVVPLSQGEAVIFPVHHRPVQGTRGVHRVTMRHGVSRITGGIRQTLGIIFHDAA